LNEAGIGGRDGYPHSMQANGDALAGPPTLVAYDALWLEGKALGLGPAEFDKIDVVCSGGLTPLEIMRDAGFPMAFGSVRKYHCMDSELLAKVLTPAEIIRSATVVGAELCQMAGQIRTIAKGAFADLVVVEGDPLGDIALLQGPICR
jgi:imidazolonepropionase-like amidohydrolase